MKRRQWPAIVGLMAVAMVASVLGWIGARGSGGDGAAVASPRQAVEAGSAKHETRRETGQADRMGEVRVARLADMLARASYVGPELRKAYFALRAHWRKMVDPYGDLPPERSFLRLKVAFLVPDVAHYLDPRFPKVHVALGSGERTWSYTRGVYESRLALFSPLEQGRDTRLTFSIKPSRGAVLWFGVGAIPLRRAGGQVELWIDVVAGGKSTRIYHRSLGAAQMLSWHPDRVDLGRWAGRSVRLVLGARGKDAAALWMDPAIWGPGRIIGDNVIFLVVDTMRPDAIHALGGTHARTPNMDRLVEQGTALTRFFANGSWTRASIVSFFSANYASVVGLTPDKFIFPSRAREKFYRRRLPQFPAHMERLGYAVFAVVNNFFGLPYTAIGVDHGFSSFTDVRHPMLDSRAITRAAVDFLRRHRHRPFFLYIHYEALHDYDRRPDYWANKFPVPAKTRMEKYWRAYLSLGMRVDEEVGRLMAAVERLGLQRRTLVILTADHGEVFDSRHDHYIPFFRTKTLHQHARSVWDEVLHIPMVWAMPGRVPPGRRVSTQLRAIDLFPSVLEFLGLPSMGPVAGRSFASSIASDPGEKIGDRPVYAEGFHIRALRQAGFKYIYRDSAADRFVVKNRTVTKTEELFDLSRDPAEIDDLAPRMPKMVARMRAAMQRIPRDSDPAKLAGSTTERQVVLHLRYCSVAGKKRATATLTSRRQGALTVAGALGRLVVRPVSCGKTHCGVTALMAPGKGCSGLDVLFDGPLRLSVSVDGQSLSAGKIRVGAYGLSLLGEGLVAPWDARLVSSRRPAVLDKDPDGLFVWTNRSASQYVDPLAGQRDERSDRLVRSNLLHGGYVKTPSRRR